MTETLFLERIIQVARTGPYGRWGHEFHLHPLDWGQWLAQAGYVVLMPNPREVRSGRPITRM